MAGILMGCLLSYTSEAARKHHTMLHVGVRGTSSLRQKHGGELKAAYATLGGIDLVMIADLPDNARAMAASAALAKATGIGFTTAPAVTIDEFDKLAG